MKQGTIAVVIAVLVAGAPAKLPRGRYWLPGGITTGPHYELDRVYHKIHFKPGDEAPDFALFPLDVIDRVVDKRPELQLSTDEYLEKYALQMKGRSKTGGPYAGKPVPWARKYKDDPLEKKRVRLSSFRGRKPVLLLLGSYG